MKKGQRLMFHPCDLKTLLAGLVFGVAMLPPLATAQDQVTTAPAAASSTAEPTDADLAGLNCAIGEEKFLPGDYYYCLGSQSYGLNRYGNAQRFFTTAASWASKPAQYVLGVMALNGDHEPVNRPLALAWLTLAAERSNSRFRQALDDLLKTITPDEHAQAESLLATMRATYADSVAAPRAEHRYTTGMAELVQIERLGGQYCMAGMTRLSDQSQSISHCPPVGITIHAVDATAAVLFDGWTGHVQVGPLEQAGTKPPAQTN